MVTTKRNWWWLWAGVGAIIFIVWTLLVKFVDVQTAATGGQIGFGGLNIWFFNAVGTSNFWLTFTNWLGYLTLGLIGVLVMVVLVQWIRRRSLWRVDKNLLAAVVVLLGLAIIYGLFELVTINVRPIWVNGVLKPSYPSTHTMLFAVVLPLLIGQLNHYVPAKPWRVVGTIGLVLLLESGVIGRALCGMHWLTDIVAGLMASATLLACYLALTFRAHVLS